MSTRVPIEHVIGAEEVTIWLWPNDPDPVTVRLEKQAWAKLERKAEEHTDGDMEQLVGTLLEKDIMENHLSERERREIY